MKNLHITIGTINISRKKTDWKRIFEVQQTIFEINFSGIRKIAHQSRLIGQSTAALILAAADIDNAEYNKV